MCAVWAACRQFRKPISQHRRALSYARLLHSIDNGTFPSNLNFKVCIACCCMVRGIYALARSHFETSFVLFSPNKIERASGDSPFGLHQFWSWQIFYFTATQSDGASGESWHCWWHSMCWRDFPPRCEDVQLFDIAALRVLLSIQTVNLRGLFFHFVFTHFCCCSILRSFRPFHRVHGWTADEIHLATFSALTKFGRARNTASGLSSATAVVNVFWFDFLISSLD